MTREEVSLLREAYDTQLRAHVHDRLPDSVQVERDGPLLRTVGFGSQGWVEYRDLAGLEGPALDTLIARQVRFFAERGERFEWKYHGHDLPADLPERLRAAGFVPEETETVVIGRVDTVAAEPRLPEGVVIREVLEPDDFARIARLEASVWGGSTTAGSTTSPRSVRPTRRAFASSSPRRATSRSAPAGFAFLPARSS